MGKMQRDKGKRGELEVAAIARSRGFDQAKRSGDAGQPDGDLDHMPDFTSVKWHEQLRIPEWLRELEAARPRDREGVLVFRRSHEPWKACLDLGFYLDLRR